MRGQTGRMMGLAAAVLLGAGAGHEALAQQTPGPEPQGEQTQQAGQQAQGIEPEAEARLREMSDYLGSLQSFTVAADSSTEVVLKTGQKLEYDARSKVSVRRPDRLRSDRVGQLAQLSFYYDGQRLTLYGQNQNLYAQAPAPATLDETIAFASDKLGLFVPGSDLLLSDPYEALGTRAKTGTKVGETLIDGVRCDHLAFRGDGIDWQVWIEQGPRPLPRKYVLTTMDQKGEPEFSVQLSDWNTEAELSEDLFRFVPPPEAKQIDFLGLIPQRGKGPQGGER